MICSEHVEDIDDVLRQCFETTCVWFRVIKKEKLLEFIRLDWMNGYWSIFVTRVTLLLKVPEVGTAMCVSG